MRSQQNLGVMPQATTLHRKSGALRATHAV